MAAKLLPFDIATHIATFMHPRTCIGLRKICSFSLPCSSRSCALLHDIISHTIAVHKLEDVRNKMCVLCLNPRVQYWEETRLCFECMQPSGTCNFGRIKPD